MVLLVVIATIITVAALTPPRPRDGLRVKSFPDNDSEYQYFGELIKWHDCPEEHTKPLWRLECATMDVPQDHFNKANSETFTIHLVRSRGRNATKNVLFNPGGPGASGYGMILHNSWMLHPRIGEDYHLVGFDPRGISRSVPQEKASLDKSLLVPTNELSDLPPKTPSENKRQFSRAQEGVGQVLEHLTAHDQFVNTPQTAADMNTMLDMLGQDHMYYWGVSYGTILGQTFATMYPNRTERMILDGVANHFEWYLEPFMAEAFHDTLNSTMDFAQQCFDSRDQCAMSPFFKTKDEARKLVDSIVFPLDIVESSNFDEGFFTAYLFEATYSPGANWSNFAEDLAMALIGNREGNTSSPLPKEADLVELDAGNIFSTIQNKLIVLNDKLRTGVFKATELASLAMKDAHHRQKNRAMSLVNPNELYLPTLWPLRKTHSYRPRSHVKTKYPILFLSTTNDPITPLLSAKKASEVFEGSRVIQINGTGHGSHSVPSMEMARKMVAYLRNGSLPEEKVVVCQPDENFSAFLPIVRRIQLLLEAKKIFAGDETEDDRLQFAVTAGALELDLPVSFWSGSK